MQNIQDLKTPVLGLLMKFYLLGTGTASLIYQASSKAQAGDLGRSPQFFSHLKVGIVHSIPLLCFTLWSGINHYHMEKDHVICS